jgi:hypothetical protein
MKKKIYIGIDNGVTGTVSVLDGKSMFHFPVPIKKELSYTKKKQYITRIDTEALEDEFWNMGILDSNTPKFCLLERPMINPMRFKQSISAARALEAMLIVINNLEFPFEYVDSKEWQKMFIPKGILALKSKNKSKELKRAAVDVARRLFPKIDTKDADSLLIMEYARRKGL